MDKRLSVLLMVSVAAVFLCFREVTMRGGFLGGIAVGILIVWLIIEWSNYFRRRGPGSEESL